MNSTSRIESSPLYNPDLAPVSAERRTWGTLDDYYDLLPPVWRNPSEEARRAGHGGGDYHEIRDFVEAARSGSRPPIDIYTSLEWTAAGLCSRISIENGGVPIKLPNFRDPGQRPILLDAP